MWYWLVVWDSDGSYWIVNRYASESAAERAAEKLDVAGYEIEKLPTINSSEATRQIKGILVEKDPKKFKSLKKFKRVKKSKE